MPRLKPSEAASLDPQSLEAENATRAPTNQFVPKCPAKKRKGEDAGRPCGRAAGAGTSHEGVGYCSSHGGNTPAGKKAAARAYGRQLILDHKERFGGDRTNPFIQNVTAEAALLEELRRSVAMVRWLEEKIGEWQLPVSPDPDQAEAQIMEGRPLNLPPLVEETSKGAPGSTDVQAWLLLYREERKHAATVAKMCIDAKIANRLVDLAESQGKFIANIVKFAFARLDLTPDQAAKVPQIVPDAIARANAAFDRQNKSRDWDGEAPSYPHQIETVYTVTDAR